MEVTVRQAHAGDAMALAALAAVTFPLACPPDTTQEAMASFIKENLGEQSFAGYLTDPARVLFVAQEVVTSGAGRLLAYSMLIDAPPSDLDVAALMPQAGAVELSKCYAHPDVHGHGVSAALMKRSLEWVSRQGSRATWLGVNSENLRAQAFYGKSGFQLAGTRSFQLGKRVEHDHVMVRPAKDQQRGI